MSSRCRRPSLTARRRKLPTHAHEIQPTVRRHGRYLAPSGLSVEVCTVVAVRKKVEGKEGASGGGSETERGRGNMHLDASWAPAGRGRAEHGEKCNMRMLAPTGLTNDRSSINGNDTHILAAKSPRGCTPMQRKRGRSWVRKVSSRVDRQLLRRLRRRAPHPSRRWRAAP